MKYLLSVIIIPASLLSGMVVMANSAFAQSALVNLALHKPYTMSPKPNFRITTDSGDSTQLTDGKIYTSLKKKLWVKKSTVGWRSTRGPVTITIDLGKIRPISGVSLHSGGGNSGVTFPQSIAILVSDNGKNYSLIGDLVRMSQTPLPPPYGKLALCTYSTTSLQTKGRYVRFVITPGLKFFFCDEIQVYECQKAWLHQPAGGKPVKANWYPSALWLTRSGVHRRIRSDLQQVENLAHKHGMLRKLQNDFEKIRHNLSGMIYPANLNGFRAVLPINHLDKQVFKLRAKILAKQSAAGLVVWHTPPYKMLSLFSPTPPSSVSFSLKISLMQNGQRSEAFNITNATQQSQAVSFTIKGLPGGINPSYVHPSQVEYVDTRTGLATPSALVALKAKNSKYTTVVPSGMTRQVWLTFKPKHVQAGDYNGRIIITSESGKLSHTIPIAIYVSKLRMPNRLDFSVCTWDYIFQKNYGITVQNQQAARKFIKDSRVINTVTASTAVAPIPTKSDYDKQGYLIGSIDFSKWDAYIKFWPHMRHYYIFINYKRRNHNSFCGFKSGTPQFKRAVSEWAAAWAKHNRKLDLKPGQVLATFVDEPRTKQQIKTTALYGNAFHAGAPDMDLISTIHAQSISKPGTLKALQYYKVLCPTRNGYYYGVNKKGKEDFQSLVAAGKQLWLASCVGPTHTFDPAYYRLQPWFVMAAGGSGEGFWAFADNGSGRHYNKHTMVSDWNPYPAVATQCYAPVYIGRRSVNSSKQFSALIEGAEDAQYYMMLQKRVKQPIKQNVNSTLLSKAKRVLRNLPTKITNKVDKEGGYVYGRHWTGVSRYAETGRLKILSILEKLNNN